MASGQYLSLPAVETGLSPASGALAWGYGSWSRVVPTNFGKGIYVTGLTFQVTNIPSLDTTTQQLFEIGTGASGSETTIVQIPHSIRMDTAVGYYLTRAYTIFLPEPVFIAPNTRIAIRVADSLASAITYDGVKILYRDGNSPTVVLNSPSDASTVSATPTLNFTGTDVESNTIEYDVQIDTVNTFNSGTGTGENLLVDSYPSYNADGVLPMCVATPYYTQMGQSFNANIGGVIIASAFQVQLNGSPVGTAVSKLYAHSGTFGTTGVPTGSALATSASIDVSTIVDGDIVTFDFSASPYTLVSGTKYVIVVEYLEASSTQTQGISLYVDSTTTHSGSCIIWNNNASSWGAVNNYDVTFFVYVKGPFLSVSSQTDSGFTAGHPFTSGSAIDYTIQNALPAGTYYWRVAGIDPSGTNQYGSWSNPIWSFVVPEPPFTISGTTTDLSTGTISVAVNSTLQAQTGSFSAGTWTISGVTKPASGATITVFISDSNETTIFAASAVTTYSGSGAIENMVLNKHTVSIGGYPYRSLALSNLANYDYDQNNRILFSVNGSPATLLAKYANGSSYVDEKINIVTGNTLTIGTTETLTAFDVEINGTLTSGGASTYVISGDWTNNGIFTASTSTVTLNGGSVQTLLGTLNGASSFYNLTITNSSGTSASDNERTGFTPGIDFNSSTRVSNNYTITTSNVRVEYQSGATFDFLNINWVGVPGNLIYFRNSDATTTWLLKVTGTQVVSYINVSRSNATVSGGKSINAYDGTNYDAGNNSYWSFTNTRIRQEINLINGSFSSLSTGPMTVGLSSLNPAYSGTLTSYYEVVATNTDSVARTVYLRNWVGDAIVAQLSIPSGTSSPTRIRSNAFTFPVSLTTVYTNGPQTTSDGQVVITAARVIILQDVGANPITGTETQIEIGNYEAGKNNVSPGASLSYPKYWLADTSKWDGTVNYYAEACYRTAATNRYCTIILQRDTAGDLTNWVNDITIVNAQASSSANYPMLSSRVAFTPISGCNYRIISYLSSSASTYNIYNAKIIVAQTGTINKLEPQYLLQNTYLNTTGLQNYDTNWDTTEWDTCGMTCYHEINSSSDTADSAKLQYNPNVIPADVAGSTTTGAYRSRSSALTMPDTNILDTYILNVPIYASRIIVVVNNLPLVVLNSPGNGQYVARLTPGLNFTGSIPNGSNLEYNIQVDTVETFNSVQSESSGTLFSNSFEAATWTSVLVSGSAAAWTRATTSSHPTGVSVQDGTYLAIFNSYTCTNGAQARYYPNTTTFDIPSNADTASLTFYMYHETGYTTLDSVQLQVSTAGSGGPWTNVGTAVSRYDTTTRWEQITVDLASYIGVNNILIGFLGTSAYGNDCHIDNVVVSYHIPAIPLITKYSVTDLGFTAGHPFVSGSDVGYTTQPINKLSESTYYWRVCATSSVGSPMYGDWSSTYNFTVSLPTVALNSPANNSTIGSLTPAVNFTGTSLQTTGTLEYNIQIDKSNTFDSIGTAWDISHVKYKGVNFYNMLDSRMYDVAFSSSGNKMYIIGNSTDTVYQCSLVSAWDISTAIYDNVSFSVSVQDSNPTSIEFSADGTKMYIFGSFHDYIYQYTLSAPWDIATAVYSTKSFHVTQDLYPYSMAFGSSGTKMYVYGHDAEWIYQYTLSTAWDISTATSDSKHYSVSGSYGVYGFYITSDGTKMFACYKIYVYQYNLSTPWDVSTAAYNIMYVVREATDPSGLAFNSDGTRMYVSGYNNGTIFQYDLVEPLISGYSESDDVNFTSGHPFDSAQAINYTSNKALVLADMYDSGPFSSVSLYSSTTATAQSFTAIRGTLDSCIFNIKKYGLPTGSIYAKLYAHSGTYGISSIPTGAALATSAAVDIASLTTTLQNISFTFSGVNRIVLAEDTHYCIAIEYVGGNSSNRLDVGFQDQFSNPKHSGNIAYSNTGVWSASATTDLRFMVYVDTQSADIYYWRAAAKDPLGTYGAWSSTRSFTVSGAKIWNGSSWQYKPVQIYNGSSWVAKPVRIWNGTDWVIK